MSFLFTLNLLFLILFIYAYRLRQDAIKAKINDQILFSFCDLRRKLMALARENKIDAHSIAFNYQYSLLSHIIHYIRDYRFLSDLFLNAIKDEEKKIEDIEFQKNLLKDLLMQDDAVYALHIEVIKNMIKAFLLTDPYFSFKYAVVAFEKLILPKSLKSSKKLFSKDKYDSYERWSGTRRYA